MPENLPRFLKFFGLSVLSFGIAGHAEQGLIGGATSALDAYASFVDVPSGNLTPVSGLPTNTLIYSVELNTSGKGIITGADGTGGYAAFVGPGGSITPISVSLLGGQVVSGSINESGNALIGGSSSFVPYAALVAPDGSINPLTLSPIQGFIQSVDINDDALGLIGGEGNGTAAYAAYISPSGTETVLSLPTDFGSFITSVAINCHGNGIVGGTVFPFAYVALTTPGQSEVIPVTNLPDFGAIISSVAINDSGLGLIGGGDTFIGNTLTGYVTSDGTFSPLPVSFLGNINSVAINSSGKGIIGGIADNTVYAAFVDPSGSVTPLINSPPAGSIHSVAIDDNGIGMFGGESPFGTGYAALVAPDGTLTFLDVSGQNVINSVSLQAVLNEIVEEITPKSIGFWNSTFFTHLAASTALEWRFVEQNKLWQRSCLNRVKECDENPPKTPAPLQQQPSKGKSFLSWKQNKNASEAPSSVPVVTTAPSSPSCPSSTKNSVWVAPFGDFIRLKKQGDLPKVENNIGGVLVGYDRQGEDFLVGGTVGYAYNGLHYGSGRGHGKMQEEMAAVYGAYYVDHFWFDAAFWGGAYQLSNVRHAKSQTITSIGACLSSSQSGPSFKSKGKTHGWILSPHLEIATPWSLDKSQHYFVEPFALFDWIYCSQDSFKERGSSGFNLKMKDLHGSLLQSEVGVRFYEKFMYCWGDFLLEEKVSYINQAPFFHKKVKTGFVGSNAEFPVVIGSTKVQNLASFGLMATFVPFNKVYPFGGLGFQADVNGSYQSYDITLFTGWNF